MECITCDIVDKIDNLSLSYSKDIFNYLAPSCKYVFKIFWGTWILWNIIFKICINGEINLQEFLIKGLMYCVITLLLSEYHHYWEWVVKPLHETTNYLLKLISQVNSDVNANKNSSALLELDLKIQYISDLCRIIYGKASFMNIEPILAGIILHVPFLIMWVLFVTYFIEFILKSLCINAIAPILIIFLGFSLTRPIVIGSFKVILHSILTLMFTCIILCLSLVMISSQVDTLPVTEYVVKQTVDQWVFGAMYWQSFITAMISIIFLVKIPFFTNSLTSGFGGNISIMKFSKTLVSMSATRKK